MNRTLPTTLTALLVAGTALSQEPPKPANVSAELSEILNTDQIQAASKKMQDTASAPADAVILRSSDLRALGYRTLGDALGGVVGFRTNEDHAYQGLAVRGLYVLGDQNTRVLVLLDGHALNNPAEVGSSKVGQDFGLPMELVDHIEIVRGPASSLYGNNAFMALVNVVSVDAANSRHSAVEGAMGAGPGGAFSAWVDGGATLGGVKISLMASGFGRQGTAQTYPQLSADAPAYGQPLPAGSDHEDSQSAYLRLAGREWSFAGSYLNRVQRLASGPFYFKPGDEGNTYTNKRLSGDFRWQPSVGRVQWLVRLFGDRSEFQDTFTADPVRGSTEGQWDKDPDWSLGAEIQARATLGDRFALTAGSEQRFHHFSDTTLAASTWITSEVKYRIGNTYLEGSFQVSNDVNLVLGLQEAEYAPASASLFVDGVQVTSMTVPATGEVIPFRTASIRRETPRFSVIYTPDQADVLKVIYGQGFRFPTLFEAYYSDATFFYPNANLEPEVLTSEQLSWSRRWSAVLRSQMSASLFQWDHLIQAGSLGDGQQFRNGSTRIKGKALEAEFNLNLAPTTVSGGMGWYTWEQGSQNLDNTATWNAVLKVIHSMDAWSLAGELRYVGPRETAMDAASGDPGTQVPANVSVRGSVRYDRLKWWVQATVEDATDGRRKDLVAKDYAPITWMASNGRSLWLQAGFRF